MSEQLEAYLRLERAIAAASSTTEADALRDEADHLWLRLSAQDRAKLDARHGDA